MAVTLGISRIAFSRVNVAIIAPRDEPNLQPAPMKRSARHAEQ